MIEDIDVLRRAIAPDGPAAAALTNLEEALKERGVLPLVIYRRALNTLAHPNRDARKQWDDIDQAVSIASMAIGEAEELDHDLVFVSDDRKVLVNVWRDGTVTAALRTDPNHLWGPPVKLRREV